MMVYEVLIRIMGPIFSWDVEYVTVTIAAESETKAYEYALEGFSLGFDINLAEIIAVTEVIV